MFYLVLCEGETEAHRSGSLCMPPHHGRRQQVSYYCTEAGPWDSLRRPGPRCTPAGDRRLAWGLGSLWASIRTLAL